MSAHPSEHQDLVDRILGGELAEDDARVRTRLEACADCRSELARLRALDVSLRAAARQARRDVEEARARPSPSDEALVRGSLLAALSVERGARARRPFALVALAAGLLLLLGLGLYFTVRSQGASEPEILLHGGSLVCGGAVGSVDDYDEFSWTGGLPPGGRFELRIHALEDDQAGPLLKTIACEEPRWIPTPEEKHALPDEIYWEVATLDVSERSVERGWAKASRRSR